MGKIIFEIIKYAVKRVYKFATSQPYLFDKYLTKGLDSYYWYGWAILFLVITFVFSLSYIDSHAEKPLFLMIAVATFISFFACDRKANSILAKERAK